MKDTETSHFWVGYFPGAKRVGEYFKEVYDEDSDDTPISQFARDQGVEYYDHDFIEYGFSKKKIKSLEGLFSGTHITSNGRLNSRVAWSKRGWRE